MEPHRADRRFGQNFLANAELAEALVRDFDPGTDDVVVEIGPGKGALTRVLAERVGRLVALELDERLIPALEQSFSDKQHVEIRRADAARVDWDALADELGARLRVIGNLPFNVGTVIVRALLASERIADMQLMLQLEVAERVRAEPNSKSYGPLSVIAALRCRRRLVRKLSPGAFRPMPKVSAGVVELRFLEEPPLAAAQIDRVESWLHAGFAQRRKTLVNNLSAHRDLVESFLAEHGLPPNARAEQVPPETWLELTYALPS